MAIWEADCYRRPLTDEQGETLWELLICDAAFTFTYGATVAQSQVSSVWLVQQLQTALKKAPQAPSELRVFRPQALNLLQTSGQSLGLEVRPMRQTPALKQWLVQRSKWYASQPNFSGDPYQPLALQSPPPAPVPQEIWGTHWRFGSLSAQDFQAHLLHEPIPIQSVPTDWLPLKLGIASTTAIPGIIIDAGQRSRQLANWLAEQQPAALAYMPGKPDGILLESGLVDRWVLVTFDDPVMQTAAKTFVSRQQQARGLHFLLVRPDDSGMTFTGLWLLRA